MQHFFLPSRFQSRASQRRASRRPLRRQGGFTLMELMAVVVIIGVLSSVAIPSLNRFIRRSRESEAPTNLAAIARGARDYYNAEHINKATGVVNPPRFPPIASSENIQNTYATMPTVAPCAEISGSPRYRNNSARWHANHTKEPWVDLKFALARSHYFQYGFKSENEGKNATYSARARADMDCDGSLSTFLFSATVDSATGEIMHNAIIVFNQGE